MSVMRWAWIAIDKEVAMLPRIAGPACASVAALIMAFTARTASAAEVMDIEAKKFLNDHGCNACHGVDEMRIGPSYVMVAARYPNASPAIVERLSYKILVGGAGSWG